MKAPERILSSGSDRMNGLLAWWGIPGVSEASDMNARVQRTLALVAELNKHFQETSCRQSEALSAANGEFVHALQQLMSARQPADVVSAQSRIMRGVANSFAAQTEAWAELMQKIYECCAVATRDGAVDAAERVDASACLASQRHAERTAVQEAAGSLVQA